MVRNFIRQLTTENLFGSFKLLVITAVFASGVCFRLQYFGQTSKDIYAYTRAISDLRRGINPYRWTVESFSNPDDPSNHGFSYLPGTLYLFSLLSRVSEFSGIHYKYLWKIPVLLCDVGVGLFLIKKTPKAGILVRASMLLCWFFNPYIYFRGGYTFFDPITIFLMLMSLHYLGKNNLLSGIVYGLAVSTKTFPYVIFPVFLLYLLPHSIQQIRGKSALKSLSLGRFLFGGLFVALVISLPFITTLENFSTYLNGAIFVHSTRFVQGRPFLYYISYYYKIELFRIISFKTYTLLASFSGWFPVLVFYFMRWFRDKYVMSVVPFLTFYLFTPVLNRTYLIWFIPLLLLGSYRISRGKHKVIFFVVTTAFYVFYSWYLLQWKDGFHIWHPI
jgi:hypothetical protein